jgi:tetratricopeptide (TPR) repeat protein
VGFDPDPIRGGKLLIQAMRYTNTVDVAVVRDLYGTVVNEGATRGILITTSDYSEDSYEFAKGKPLQLINGRKLLKVLELQGHIYRIDIAEAKKLLKNGDDLDSDPNNAAFPAMPQYQLGKVDEGRSAINTFRDSLEEIRFADITSVKLSSWIAAETIFAGTNEQLLAIWELIGTKKLDEAVTLFAEIQLSPKDADSDFAFSLQGLVQYLSRICYARGKSRLLETDQGYIDRASDYEAAISIDPNYVSVLKDLAWLQTTCPVKKVINFTKAIELATQACELTDYKNHECISILAASYSETGNFDAAVKWQKTAIASLLDDYPIALRANYEARCGVYQSHQPYHKGSLWSLSDGELVAHWKFDEIYRGEVLDSTGKGLHGRLVGNAHIVSDEERGRVLRLPGKGDFVDCGWNSAFDIIGSITISAWTKVTEPYDRWKTIVSTNKSGLGLVGKDPNHVILGYWYRDDVWIQAELDVDNQWHLIVGLYDGQEFALYIDGKLCASKRFYKSISMDTGRLYIGQAQDHSNEGWKDGLIDDIRIYSYALNAEEIKMLYEGKEPPRAKGSD